MLGHTSSSSSALPSPSTISSLCRLRMSLWLLSVWPWPCMVEHSIQFSNLQITERASCTVQLTLSSIHTIHINIFQFAHNLCMVYLFYDEMCTYANHTLEDFWIFHMHSALHTVCLYNYNILVELMGLPLFQFAGEWRDAWRAGIKQFNLLVQLSWCALRSFVSVPGLANARTEPITDDDDNGDGDGDVEDDDGNEEADVPTCALFAYAHYVFVLTTSSMCGLCNDAHVSWMRSFLHSYSG